MSEAIALEKERAGVVVQESTGATWLRVYGLWFIGECLGFRV
jgi:hypothetical protein